MSLDERSMGYELSGVERELACNPDFADVGYVRYDSQDGYFYLDPSKYLKTTRNEIYHIGGPRPPEETYVKVRVDDVQTRILDAFGDRWVTIKEISRFDAFDVTQIARKRGIMDFREVIEFFTYPYRGESDEVLRIARCSCLFACSAPPVQKDAGGISSAVFGRNYQWAMFKKPLMVIPPEFRRVSADVYYQISTKEKTVNKKGGEINRAILLPETMVSDIPVVIYDVSQRTFQKDYFESLMGEASIIRAQLLDSLLIRPEESPAIEKAMREAIYVMRNEHLSGRRITYRQNIGDAIPRLAASYARLQSSPEIDKGYIDEVMNDWQFMHEKACSMHSSPMGIIRAFSLTGDSRRIYFALYDAFGSDYAITPGEGQKVSGASPEEYGIALDSIVETGYGRWKKQSIVLLDP
jgi:hypothetical protein